MKKIKEKEGGFTLLELMLVLVVIAIISAIVVPEFTTVSSKARVAADTMSVKTVQQQLDMYALEVGNMPTSSVTNNVNVNEYVIKELQDNHYLDSKYLEGGQLVLQTSGAACKYDATLKHYVLVVSKAVYDTLKEDNLNKGVWVISENTHNLTIN